MHKTLKISEVFSKTPGPRYILEGNFSGELFRKKHLFPEIKDSIEKKTKLVVDLDGTNGYGSSFLEEAFRGLVREEGLAVHEVLNVLVIKSDEEEHLENEVFVYIKKEEGQKVDECLKDKQHDLLFGVRRSVLYHNRRYHFFEKTNNYIECLQYFLILVFFTKKELSLFCFIFYVMTDQTKNQMFRKTTLHSGLVKRFIALEKKIVKVGDNIDDDTLNNFTTERLDIEANEPPILRGLDCICHNQLMRSMGYDKKDFVTIRWYQRLVSQFIDIQSHSI